MNITVMGLIGKQQAALKARYPHHKFKFIELSGRPRGGSYIFVMLKFLSHDHVQAIQKNYDKSQIIYIHGGISQLRQAIDGNLRPRHSQVPQAESSGD